MKTSEILRAWHKILKGERPSLSIEITRECPLRCPGCYAYDDAHLGGGMTLRGLRDRKGQELIDGVLEIVDRLKPLHLSIVGGDPLVRYRELELMIPLLIDRGIYVQLVTSAFRALSPSWATQPHMNIVVSIDGLQPEHDVATRSGHLRSDPEEHRGPEHHDPLHDHWPDDEATRLFEEISAVLDTEARDPEGMVQLVHAASRRSVARNVATR